MKAFDKRLEKYRVVIGAMGSTSEAGRNGAFILAGPLGRKLVVVAYDGKDWVDTGIDGQPWEHVSVHGQTHGGQPCLPAWPEMVWIKNLWWDKSEGVVQFHPPESEYVNNHKYVLHLWRPVSGVFPMPQRVCV